MGGVVSIERSGRAPLGGRTSQQTPSKRGRSEAWESGLQEEGEKHQGPEPAAPWADPGHAGRQGSWSRVSYLLLSPLLLLLIYYYSFI